MPTEMLKYILLNLRIDQLCFIKKTLNLHKFCNKIKNYPFVK